MSVLPFILTPKACVHAPSISMIAPMAVSAPVSAEMSILVHVFKTVSDLSLALVKNFTPAVV